jgi:hypothetical protein
MLCITRTLAIYKEVTFFRPTANTVYVAIGGFKQSDNGQNMYANDLKVYYCKQYSSGECTGRKNVLGIKVQIFCTIINLC